MRKLREPLALVRGCVDVKKLRSAGAVWRVAVELWGKRTPRKSSCSGHIRGLRIVLLSGREKFLEIGGVEVHKEREYEDGFRGREVVEFVAVVR